MSNTNGPENPVNYWEYIRVEDLLGLQSGLENGDEALANDEVVFITVHQVYELWFKLILRELRTLRDQFRADPVAEQELSSAHQSLERIVTILRLCIDHFQVVETITTRNYLAFRDKLMPASGFQSAQLRQIEIVMGLEEELRIPLGMEQSYLDALRAHDGSESSAWKHVQTERTGGPSLREVIDEWLYRTPIDGMPGDDSRVDAFVEEYAAAHAAEMDKACGLALARARVDADRDRLRARYDKEKQDLRDFLAPAGDDGQVDERLRRVRAAILFITTYQELPLLAWPRRILEGLVEFEQVFTIFRQRHARMVERVIGRRTGTGGSAGVDYLDQTALRYRVFEDLWASRTLQIRQAASPKVHNAQLYGFRYE